MTTQKMATVRTHPPRKMCSAFRLAIAILSLLVIVACSRDERPPQPSDSMIPPKVWKHLPSESDKICAELAYRRIKAIGRPYHFTAIPGVDESIKDIWISEQLLRIPRKHIMRVNYGSGHLIEVPGIEVQIHGWLPDMATTLSPLIHNEDGEIRIRISCLPGTIEESLAPEEFTEKLLAKRFTQELPEMGLFGSSDHESVRWIYSPRDRQVKSFNGRSLLFTCERRYPITNNSRDREECHSGFLLRDRVGITYSFRATRLPDWRNINEQVIRLTKSFVTGET